jgi:deoxyribose-phosphate aldolase
MERRIRGNRYLKTKGGEIKMNVSITKEQLAKMIDHTPLKPTATEKDIKKLCTEAKKYGFASVCVNPFWVSLVSKLLKGTSINVDVVIGFPIGASTSKVKAFEAKDAIEHGAKEIDMVINIGALKSGKYTIAREDIKNVVKVAHSFGNITIKAIIETCYLTDEEKVISCKFAKEAGADYVKTSTGFGSGGATCHDVRLMRETVGKEMGVKASGGIRTLEDALELIKAGATRIGTSHSIDIITSIDKKPPEESS